MQGEVLRLEKMHTFGVVSMLTGPGFCTGMCVVAIFLA